MKKNNLDNIGRDILFGVAVGDALGVPVEFELREDLLENPVMDMRSYGLHHYQPKQIHCSQYGKYCLGLAFHHLFL